MCYLDQVQYHNGCLMVVEEMKSAVFLSSEMTSSCVTIYTIIK
jgi:hypothetical protein